MDNRDIIKNLKFDDLQMKEIRRRLSESREELLNKIELKDIEF